MAAMTHGGVGGDQPIDVAPGAVAAYEAAGWRLEQPPEGHVPAAPPEPPAGEPPLELVPAVNPAQGCLEAQVTPGQLDHLRAAGWMTAAEHAANVAAEVAARAERTAAEEAERTPAATIKPRRSARAADHEPAGPAGEQKED